MPMSISDTMTWMTMMTWRVSNVASLSSSLIT